MKHQPFLKQEKFSMYYFPAVQDGTRTQEEQPILLIY